MDAKTLKKLADQLDTIAENFTALSATFRSGGGSADGGSVDGKAGKAVPAKSGKSKPAAEPDDDASDEEIDVDTLREKLKELAETKGKEAMIAALAEVGAGALKDVDESQYKECYDKAVELLNEDESESAEDTPPAKPAAKKAAAKKGGAAAKKVTLKQLQEAAAALIEADKPAYLKLAKKFGKPSEAEADTYADFLSAVLAAMPETTDEGDDDLL